MRMDENVKQALLVLQEEGHLRPRDVRNTGGVPTATVRLPGGTIEELRAIATGRGEEEAVYECELAYPMYGEAADREPFGVETIRGLAFPVLVCRFEGVSLASAERRRGEINQELRSAGWPELGDLVEVDRKTAIR